MSRHVAVAMLWPESSEENASAALRKSLYHLRRKLGPKALRPHGRTEVSLDLEKVWSDVAAFEEAIEEHRWEEALEIYRGDFLRGLHIRDAGDFERWVDQERSRLRLLAERAALQLAEAALLRGENRAAARYARRGLTVNSRSSAVMIVLLEALMAAGEDAEAAATFEQYRHELDEVLGIDPPASVKQLASRIGAGGQRFMTQGPPAGLPGMKSDADFRLLCADRLQVARRLGNSIFLLQLRVVPGEGTPSDEHSAEFLANSFRSSDLLVRTDPGRFALFAVAPAGHSREAWWRGINARLLSAPDPADVHRWLALDLVFSGPALAFPEDDLWTLAARSNVSVPIQIRGLHLTAAASPVP